MPDKHLGLILNVDDTEANRYATTRILRKAGYEVVEARTGEEALRLAAESRPEMVLLDIHLPDMLGYEVARRLRADPGQATTPILQISASFTRSDDKVEGLDSGADAYLAQPVEPAELIATVRALIRARRAEASLRASEERYRLIVESATDHAIFTMDARGRVTTWNAAAERILGWKEAEIVGQDLSPIFTPEDRAAGAHVKELESAASTGCAEDERWHVRKDGVRFFASGVVAPLRAGGTEVRGFIKIMRDMTERKVAEEQLKGLNETLEQRVAERTAEAERRSGQLRTLASELTLAEQRERRRIATELHDHLAQLLVVCKMRAGFLRVGLPKSKAKDLTELEEFISQALDYTRTLMADLSPMILHEEGLVAGLEWLAPKMTKHKLAVEVRDDGEPKPLSEDMLVIVFQTVRELLFNVVKHARTDKAIVTLAAEGDRLRVTVEDKGAGFDAANHRFDPDTRGGFGLFNVRERLGAMGGGLEIASAPGRGTTATVTAPLATPVERPADPHAAAPAARVPAKGRGPEAGDAKVRVLLVDDHEIVREGLRSVIQACPDLTVVAEAPDGEEAVRIAREVQPDVVVMDVNMPRMNGLEATRRITSESARVKVIGLSVHQDQDVAASMRKAGAAAYLTKDGPSDTLCNTIRSLAQQVEAIKG